MTTVTQYEYCGLAHNKNIQISNNHEKPGFKNPKKIWHLAFQMNACHRRSHKFSYTSHYVLSKVNRCCPLPSQFSGLCIGPNWVHAHCWNVSNVSTNPFLWPYSYCRCTNRDWRHSKRYSRHYKRTKSIRLKSTINLTLSWWHTAINPHWDPCKHLD